MENLGVHESSSVSVLGYTKNLSTDLKRTNEVMKCNFYTQPTVKVKIIRPQRDTGHFPEVLKRLHLSENLLALI